MTLQDDIARLWSQSPAGGDIPEAIADGLERDKVIIDRADLPRILKGCDEAPTKTTAEEHMADACYSIAMALHLQSRESEAAVLEARRDGLARELGCRGPHGVGYQYSTTVYQQAVDRIIAEQDRAAAAEAEVARMKGEGQ